MVNSVRVVVSVTSHFAPDSITREAAIAESAAQSSRASGASSAAHFMTNLTFICSLSFRSFRFQIPEIEDADKIDLEVRPAARGALDLHGGIPFWPNRSILR
jgi:hypothetical protein